MGEHFFVVSALFLLVSGISKGDNIVGNVLKQAESQGNLLNSKISSNNFDYVKYFRPQSCVATSADIEGPYYIKDAPYRWNTPICPQSDITAAPLQVIGRVLYSVDCQTPVKATIDIWQTGVNSSYAGVKYLDPQHEHGIPKDPDNDTMVKTDYNCRGKIVTDAQGNFVINTAYPGLYTGRPRHIHVRLTAPGYKTLTSQIYFDDDDARKAYGDTQKALYEMLPTCGQNSTCKTFMLNSCFGCRHPSQIALVERDIEKGFVQRRTYFNFYLKQNN